MFKRHFPLEREMQALYYNVGGAFKLRKNVNKHFFSEQNMLFFFILSKSVIYNIK